MHAGHMAPRARWPSYATATPSGVECRASPTSPAPELTDTTRFRIGSITKPIVALLVLDAVDRGELALDDIVTDLIPGAIKPEPPTTVRMLLDHSSGIFNVGDEGDIAADIANLPDPVMRAAATELGTRYLSGERVSMNDELYIALADTHDPLLRTRNRTPLQQRELPTCSKGVGAGHRHVAR